jgi:uncharacterized protein (DUF488 family)
MTRPSRVVVHATGYQCASVGYQGKSLVGLCDLLVHNGIHTLIDVRARAWSHRPDFRKGKLSEALTEAGVRYLHCREAGNPFRVLAGELSFVECAARYERHVASNPTVLQVLRDLIPPTGGALFCLEASRHSCHRGILLASLAKAWPGLQVVDL